MMVSFAFDFHFLALVNHFGKILVDTLQVQLERVEVILTKKPHHFIISHGILHTRYWGAVTLSRFLE